MSVRGSENALFAVDGLKRALDKCHRLCKRTSSHSHLCQIETPLSKPNDPSSKCHFDDKIIPT